MNNSIEIPKGGYFSKEYTEREKSKAIALLKFRHPDCKIEIEELDNKIIVKAVEKTREEREAERTKKNSTSTATNNVLELNSEGDER